MRIFALMTDVGEGCGGIARFNRDFLHALSLTNSLRSGSVLPVARPPQSSAARNDFLGKWSYALRAVITFFQKGPFDFIFCGHLHLALLAALLARAGRIPFWLQLYGIEAWERPSQSLRWASEQALLVTAVSRYTRRRFLKWGAVAPSKVRVLPGTVDRKFQPGPKPDYLLKRYGLTGKKVLLTLSRLSSRERYKGHEQIIRLMPELLKTDPQLVYLIAGEGDDRGRLETLARESGLNGAVYFTGEVLESELADLYRTADLFVMPSQGEGFGIAFLEAAACGIPVVGGCKDGSVDALREGQIGEMTDPEDIEGLKTAIFRGLKSKRSGWPKVDPFSSKNFSHQVESLLKEISAAC